MSYINQSFDQQSEDLSICKTHSPSLRETSIAWRNLRYEVSQFQLPFSLKRKIILNRVNGHFEYHTLNGLMGPSGAGKTTLLNCLSGSVQSGLSDDSEIFVNSTEKATVLSYFIEQHVNQTIIGCLKVGQIFRYAFKFKNKDKTNDDDFIDKHVDSILKELLLPKEILNRYFEKCSGGEQKRIAIGQELMCLEKPSFLFLDEPTTGLDSASAFEVISCLKRLTVNYRITVIASIHAPNHETLALFDSVYVLARGGVCVYSGAPNKIRSYLEKEIQFEFDAQQPSIEALIKIACYDLNNQQVTQLSNHVLSDEFNQITNSLSDLQCKPFGFPNVRKRFSIGDLFLQIRRQFRITFISNYRVFLYQILFYVLNCAVIATIFSADMVKPTGCYSLDIRNQTCKAEIRQNSLIGENFNYLNLTMAVVGFAVVLTSTVLFGPIVKVFRNEHRNRWYSLGTFFWSVSVTSAIELACFVLAVSIPSYFFTFQQAADNYEINWIRLGHFVMVVWLKAVYSQTVGQLMGILVINSPTVAIVLTNLIYNVMDSYNDFFVKADELDNKMMYWMSEVVGLKFITRYLMYTFYGLDRCDLDNEFSIVMVKHLVDPNKIGFYIARIMLNVVLIKIATLIIMYCKFNTFNFKSRSTKKSYMKPIDHVGKQANPIDLNNNLDSSSTVEVNYEKSQMRIFQFLQNKPILTFRNLSLYKSSSILENSNYNESNQPETILRNLNGQFQFGTLNALMGMSGAGKTSLLRVLNGQSKIRLSQETQFYLSKYTRIQTVFISQDVSSHLMPGLTALQSLVYASRLKNPGKVDHELIGLNILEELNLNDIEHTQVQRCSGGERKRLALALELTALQMPNFICIDEPTSGLDSNSAQVVIACLQKLTHKHQLTIIASIHQPNSEVLMTFDQIYVLAYGGVCVYSGPPSHVYDHLNLIPEIACNMKSKYAIEELIKLSCKGHRDSIVQKLIQENNLVNSQSFAQTILDTQIAPDGIVINRNRFTINSLWILSLRNIAFIRAYLWKEWLVLGLIIIFFAKNLQTYWPASIALSSGCISYVEGASYNNTCDHSAERLAIDRDLQDNMKYNIFMNILFLLFVVLHASLTLYRDIEYFLNEHRNGWYSTGVFYLTKCIFEFVPLVPILLLYVYICDIYEPVRPGIYWSLLLINLVTVHATQAMSHVAMIASNQNFKICCIMFGAVFQVFLLLSNFYISIDRLHYFYQFLSNFNMGRFAFEGAILLQYGFGRCDSREVHPILYLMDLTDEYYYWCIRVLVCLAIFYRCVALYMLVNKVNPPENRREKSEQILKYSKQLQPSRAIIPGLSATDHVFRIRPMAI